MLLNGCRVDGETGADDPAHGGRSEERRAGRGGDQRRSVIRRRVADRARNTRGGHGEVAIGPDTVRAGRGQEVEAIDHRSASHGVVGTGHTEARRHGHARMTVEGERVERAVGKEAVRDRLVVRVAVVAARTRRHSRRVTSSLGRCLRSCASGATRTSGIATKLTTDGDEEYERERKAVSNSGSRATRGYPKSKKCGNSPFVDDR